MSLPFVGSKISLISKSEIRFIGILHSINHEESSISLGNVKSFGTEGRASHPSKEIPPNPNVYPLIVFKGNEVKDLRVEENASPNPQFQNPPNPTAAQSQIMNQQWVPPYYYQQQQPISAQQQYWQPPPPGYHSQSYGMSTNPTHSMIGMPYGYPNHADAGYQSGQKASQFSHPGFAEPQGNQIISDKNAQFNINNVAKKMDNMTMLNNVKSSSKKTALKTTDEIQKQKDAKTPDFSEFEISEPSALVSMASPGPKPKNSKKNTKPKETAQEEEPAHPESNVSESQNRTESKQTSNSNRKSRGRKRVSKPNTPSSIPNDFDFETSNAKFSRSEVEQEEEEVPNITSIYNKSSFFDQLSSDTTDKLKNVDKKAQRKEEQALNMETFGQARVSNNRRGRRGRGRGRGRNDGRKNENPTTTTT